MKRDASDSGEILDRAVREIRGMSTSAEEEAAILTRVKAALQSETGKVVLHPSAAARTKAYLTGCEDFQSLIPDYLSSSLTPARNLLLQDHLMECAVCWKVFEGGGAESSSRAMKEREAPRHVKSSAPSWKAAAAAVAACVLLAVALTQTTLIRNFMWPKDVNASVEALDGKVYRIVGREVWPVAQRQRIQGELVRTGPVSGAVLELADGSRIEMNERTELSLVRAPDGVVINLRRGSVIVSAAKQRGGHLYVKTPDSRVTVVGTVFAVTSGAKGSRVTVIEGQVQVQYGSNERGVAAGEQMTTNPAVPPIGFADEVKWSRDLNRHLAMLQKFAAASQTAAQTVETAGLRYTSTLIPLVPEDTVLVASLPNVDGSILQSYETLKGRISENTFLDAWWQRHRPAVDAMMRVASHVSRYLGPEIVIAAPLTAASAPVVLANAASPDAVTAALGNDPSSAVNGGLMVLSSPAQIEKTLAYQARFGTNRFQSTALYGRLAAAYTEGVGWLLAADLERITPQSPANDASAAGFGLHNMKELVVEQKLGRDGPAFFQTLGFKQARSGITSWLGDPSSMGALEFVSPNAYSAAGVVTKDANLILDDFFTMMRSIGDSRAFEDIQKFQQENNVDVRRDIAAALGNEFLVAIDGPVLPVPSWKVILEVTDPGRLQNALTWSFNELNRRAAIERKPVWSVATENRGGWTYHKAVLEGFATELHYTFVGGYLLIAPKRELLADAVRYWATGSSLGRSQEFRQQLPADGRTDFSGFVYHNIKSLTNAVPGGALAGVNVKFPTLICLYGYPDRVVISSKGVLGTDIISAEGLGVLTGAIGRR